MSTTAAAPAGMSRRLTLLFAVAGGFAVGNLYWTQPLLASIASTLGVSVVAGALLVTATQVGYAAGVLLIVPLGDSVNRRRLMVAILACSFLALVASALAPSFPVLLATLAAVGGVKRLWGFSKVRYRGLHKNATRAFTVSVLASHIDTCNASV